MPPGDAKAYDFCFATTGDEIRIKELLKNCGLPWQDITPSHLRHFLVLKNSIGITGVIGMKDDESNRQ